MNGPATKFRHLTALVAGRNSAANLIFPAPRVAEQSAELNLRTTTYLEFRPTSSRMVISWIMSRTAVTVIYGWWTGRDVLHYKTEP